jgi:hypothetical protein
MKEGVFQTLATFTAHSDLLLLCVELFLLKGLQILHEPYFYLIGILRERLIPEPSQHVTLILSGQCPVWMISTAYC